MTEFVYILLNIQLPIIILITIGYIFQKIFKTDTKTLSKLLIYILVPVMLIIKLYGEDFTWDFILVIVPFVLILQICMFLFSVFISVLLKYNRSKRKAYANSLMIFNFGNYGIPLIDLVFKSNPIAMASQILIIAIQNISSNTFCVFQASSGNESKRKALKNMFKMPALYVLVLMVIIKLTNLKIPDQVIVPLNYIAEGFVGLALITLGIQLADVQTGFRIKDVLFVSVLKVIIAPLVGLGLLLLLGIKGILAQALIIGISTPTGVNTAIIAKEFENEPDFSAGIVFMTTIFCTFTLPVIIHLTKGYIV